MSADDLLRGLLMYALLPVWLLAGFADYLCHRFERIELSAGWQESLLHLLMVGELGIGVTAALLLDINAGVLALIFGCCLAHEVTIWIDLSYASARRRIPPFEQWVHALQFSLPWAGFVGLVLLHHEQALAAVGIAGTPAADWSWRWKDPPLPLWYLVCVVLAAASLVVVPFLLEWLRSRAKRSPA